MTSLEVYDSHDREEMAGQQGGWKQAEIESAPLRVIDGDRGKQYPKRRAFSHEGHCVFLNTSNVTRKGFDFSFCDFITEERDSLLRKGKLNRGDVVLTTRGTVGNAAYYSNSISYEHIRINSGMVILRAEAGAYDPKFLYFVARSKDFQSQIQSLRTGSAQPHLPIRDLKRIEIPIPPLQTQKAIASILGALDDKIDLNRRMNETLESMARALYKSWFVDFDPVVAKAAGKRPFGMDDATAALFPDRFVDSELGPIPEGWEASTVGAIAEFPRDSRDPTDVDHETPYVGLEHMPRRSIFLTDAGAAMDVSSGKLAFRKRDLLFGKLRPYFHKVVIAPKNGLCSTDIVVVRSLHPDDEAFLWFTLFTDQFVDYATAVSGETRMPRVKWQDMSRFPIALPSDRVRRSFQRHIESLIGLGQHNVEESQTLAQLRDVLLPKLLSGEIRIKDAEKVAQEVV